MKTRRMVPRIESAEVISFRLKVPPKELEDIVAGPTGKQLGLELTTEGNERLISPAEGPSLLRFRLIGAEAILVEIQLAMDTGAVFFERVLGSLMVRHLGDLHVRLVWNVAERNEEGTGTEVRIQRGITDYPALVRNVILAAQGSLTGDESGPRPPPLPTERGGRRQSDEPVPRTSTEEKEILELLDKARAQWDEYQRLKAAKKGGGEKGEK